MNYPEKNLVTNLIKQLPKDHDGRNTWLMNNADCEESKELRVKHVLLQTSTDLDSKTKKIMEIFSRDFCDGPSAPRVSYPPMAPQVPFPDQVRPK